MRKDPASVGVGQGPMYQLEVVATVVVEVEGDSSRQGRGRTPGAREQKKGSEI